MSATLVWEFHSQRLSERPGLSVAPSSLVTEWVGDITGIAVSLRVSVCRDPVQAPLKEEPWSVRGHRCCSSVKTPLFCVPSALLPVPLLRTGPPECVKHALVLQIEKLRLSWGRAGLSMS